MLIGIVHLSNLLSDRIIRMVPATAPDTVLLMETEIEPDRGIERGKLMQQQKRELVLKNATIGVREQAGTDSAASQG